MIRWALWFLGKCAVTYAAAFTLFYAVHEEGYRIEFNTLLLSAILLVILIKLWSFNDPR